MPTLYAKKNPTTIPGFVNVAKTITLPSGEKKQVTIKRPKPGSGFEILTDEVLSNNNLDVLTKFAVENEEELNKPENAPAKKYIKARIKTEKKFRKLRADAKQKAALGIAPEKPKLDEEGGFIGLSTIKYPDYQTSSMGCWSLAYSTLLKSRGVDLSQEEIRQWRPDYSEDIADDLKPNEERKVLMNSDDVNSVYQNADLALRVLPNTAVNTFKLEPFSEQQLSIDDKPLEDFQVDAAAEAYNSQVKRQLQDTITEALMVHRSPLAVAWDGHFVTITGISKDGETIRYEDSRGADVNAPRTKTMSLDELVHNGLYLHNHNGEKVLPTGIEMTWLSDLPQAQYGNPEKPSMSSRHGDYVKMSDDGSIKISIPNDVPGLSESGKSADGQMNGKAVDEMMLLDSKELSEALGNQKVTGWGPDGKVMIGTKATYYPKKTVQLGDPKLVQKAQKNALKSFDDAIKVISDRIPHEEECIVRELKKLSAVINDGKTSPEENKKNIEKLGGIFDFLMKNDEEKNEPSFKRITSSMNDNAREELIDDLKKVNDAFGLGRGEDIKKFREMHDELATEYSNQLIEYGKKSRIIAFNQELRNKFDAVLVTMSDMGYSIPTATEKDEVKKAIYESRRGAIEDNLAYIAAAYTLQKQMEEIKIDPPYPTQEEVYAYVPEIRKSEGFKETMKGSMSWLTHPKGKREWTRGEVNRAVTAFVEEFAEKTKAAELDAQDLALYEIPKYKHTEIRTKATGIADRLDQTRTGSYTGLDIISRRKNSTAFENVKKAIRTYSQKNSPSAEDNRRVCNTVLMYLNGKSRVRTREFGRTRFNECMSFLALVMPPKKFEEYCRQINEARGVRAGHNKFIGPESFITPGTTFNDVILSSRERINAGTATDRDYARIIACTDISVTDGNIDLGQAITTKDQKKALLTETERIMANPHFKEFLNTMSKENLNALVNADASAVGDAWTQFKEQKSIEESAPAHNPSI